MPCCLTLQSKSDPTHIDHPADLRNVSLNIDYFTELRDDSSHSDYLSDFRDSSHTLLECATVPSRSVQTQPLCQGVVKPKPPSTRTSPRGVTPIFTVL